MLELSRTWRTLLVEALDQYSESLDGSEDADEVTEAVIEHVELTSEAVASVESEGIVARLEDSMEGGGSLFEELADEVRGLDELTGELLVRRIEALCEIEYRDDEQVENAADFFGGAEAFDEDF